MATTPAPVTIGVDADPALFTQVDQDDLGAIGTQAFAPR